MAVIATCPRCGAIIPNDAVWEPLAAMDGRLPIYRHRHERPNRPPRKDRRKCAVYAGPEIAQEHEAEGTAPASPA